MLKKIKKEYTKYLANKKQGFVAELLKEKLSEINNEIPVIVVSYNNIVYVKNMVSQLNQYQITPIIIDNHSSDEKTHQELNKLENQGKAKIVFSPFNYGHKVGFIDKIYETLPSVFAYTDPDLQFSADLPADFLSQLAKLTAEYRVYKAACALSVMLENGKKAHELTYVNGAQKRPFKFPAKSFTPAEWEAQWWRFKLTDEPHEIYVAKTDTTFAVYNKVNYQYDFFDSIRVAGKFSAIHLPWFPECDPMNEAEKQIYFTRNKSSTWK